MHGMINRAIQCFVRDSYGEAVWDDVARGAGVPMPGFEAMLSYDDALTWRVLDGACRRLGCTRDALLEDLGTYLVSHPSVEALRRLLRFGGLDFVDFLHSLEDLPGRARLAVRDLALPRMELDVLGERRFELRCIDAPEGFGHVLVGLMCAMADDYGALAVLEHLGRKGRVERIGIDVTMSGFSPGRAFNLTTRAA